MHFKIDSRFLAHFRNVEQVFLYITDECNLRCIQCLCKPDIAFHLKRKEMELNTALSLISDFREIGASKLTIIGGEPTLYGSSEDWKPLFTVIRGAKKIGYKYVRLDTNGQFDEGLLTREDFQRLDEITFSLDGPNPEINDPIRGRGTFQKCVANIAKAIGFNYSVNITCCLHKGLIQRDREGNLFLDKMILFVESLGVSRINFHDLFKSGVPGDLWTGNISISLEEWIKTWKEIQRNIEIERYKIPLRIPQSFVSKEEFDCHPSYYGYCPAKMGERVLIHPNGIIRICSLLIGTPYGVARFYGGKIVWDESTTNELCGHKLDRDTPCTYRSRGKYFGDFAPLCTSFKPRQKEFIWKKLRWEKKK